MRLIFSLVVSGLVAAEQGGKTYTATAAAGGSDYVARLAANRVAAIDLVLGMVLFGLFFAILALLRTSKERQSK